MRSNLPTTIIVTLIGAAFGYVANVWLMAVKYEGSDVPAGSAATGQSNLISGGLFWGIASTVIFGIGGYWKSVGTQRFFQDIRGLPAAIGSIFRQDGNAARVHLLWGAAASLVASQVISPATGAMMAVGLLATVPSLLGRFISTFVFRIWSTVHWSPHSQSFVSEGPNINVTIITENTGTAWIDDISLTQGAC